MVCRIHITASSRQAMATWLGVFAIAEVMPEEALASFAMASAT